VDASTGECVQAIRADLTLAFGTMKRGLLVARGRCGRIHVLDIGLGAHAEIDDDAPVLAGERWVRGQVPPIAADAHKGTRAKLAIVGGGFGMVGASVLAARAAMRSGIGMVRLVVARESVPIAQAAEPHALAAAWPDDAAAVRDTIAEWADAVLLGPGLGVSRETRALVERVLGAWRGPVVLDADALNVFDGDADALRTLLAGRAALLTPHAGELARLMQQPTASVVADRFESGRECARRLGCTVLSKGVPTVVADAWRTRMVSATGNPVLAQAGAGDLLAGIAATLLAQTGDALLSGICAAWIHGRAADLAICGGSVRGVTIADVTDALRRAWAPGTSRRETRVLFELPSVGDDM
jgi:hydroxyethylthiazole kinase-like uncharacterized protein yjeF